MTVKLAVPSEGIEELSNVWLSLELILKYKKVWTMNIEKFAFIFILFLPIASIAETHGEVQAAMDYELPKYTCVKPKKFVRKTEVIGAPISAAGAVSIFEGSGADEITDVDSHTMNRLKRKEDRWNKCVLEFKDDLLADIEKLKASAQYGMNQDQANIILGNMSRIQKVYMTPEGVLDDSQGEDGG